MSFVVRSNTISLPAGFSTIPGATRTRRVEFARLLGGLTTGVSSPRPRDVQQEVKHCRRDRWRKLALMHRVDDFLQLIVAKQVFPVFLTRQKKGCVAGE